MRSYLWLYATVLPVLVVLSLVLGPQTLAINTTATTTTNTLDRTIEPVVITGSALASFLGAPVDDLFVYVYQGGTWAQIPFQVDEVMSDGTYTAVEDGLFDANDEMVFMSHDLGDRAMGLIPDTGGKPIDVPWYEVEVTNPLDPSKKAWAYVVRSSTLSQTFTADYVGFDTFLHRITGTTYEVGFATPKPWLDYLSVGGSFVDILDRAPKNRLCYGSVCLFNENNAPELQDDLIKDGPVRLIVRAGRVLAYGSMAAWTIKIPSTLNANNIRYSTDFNENAVGATFYNAAVPAGVTVDGNPDIVPETPMSPWWQLSTSTGTVVQVSDTSEMGGTQTNYYVDDSTMDNSDTGDRRHYGDTGVRVDNPSSSFTYRFTLYILPGTQPNVGDTYAAYFANPLVTTVLPQQLSFSDTVYVPLVVR